MEFLVIIGLAVMIAVWVVGAIAVIEKLAK